MPAIDPRIQNHTFGYPTTPPAPPPPVVTFAAEKRLKHAATLFLVIAYLQIALVGLLVLLMLGGMGL